MSLIHLDTCGCRLHWDDEKNQVIDYDGDPCEVHKGAPFSDPLNECRAKNAVVNSAAKELDVPAEMVLWGFDDDRTAHAVQLDLASGKMEAVASSEPLSHDAFVTAIEDPTSLKVT